uniref:Menin n=1 Tax=Timema douglasi TaxID=61478 RepID=A0A7R8Z862_TIMDO|nr:unnamed protein product [Timema douglasi]
MAGFQEIDRQYFPLKDIASIKKLFKQQLESVFEPDLALLSIVVGAVENSMTCNRTFTVQKDKTTTEDNNAIEDDTKIPAVEYHIVQALYAKFHAIIKGAVDVTQYGVSKFATRDLVKKVSDVIWNSLTRSYYKDRAHLQSLYSYLTGNKLDCFGVAFAVVAGCQVLGYHDVHLALSEDHAWVVFGEDGAETAEGNEDKRGQPVAAGIGSHSWLYVNSHPVICSRHMEAAALVSAINPNLNPTTDAVQVQLLQQELLWSLYDLGHLAKYPMALAHKAWVKLWDTSPNIPWLSVSSQGLGETLGHLPKYPMALVHKAWVKLWDTSPSIPWLSVSSQGLGETLGHLPKYPMALVHKAWVKLWDTSPSIPWLSVSSQGLGETLGHLPKYPMALVHKAWVKLWDTSPSIPWLPVSSQGLSETLGHLPKYPMAPAHKAWVKLWDTSPSILWLSVSSQGSGETLGHLPKYLMALGNLGELEAANPTPGRVAPPQLFLESSLCSYTYYNNQHVYPYTYQGGYYYQHNMYKEAFNSWANAGDVIRQYNYSRDDEEIYKEFLEIANELIPHIMKSVSSGHSAHSILKDPECFAHLLRFYDGICQWEEGSATPVLHIGWAKPLVNTISKFDAEVRAQVIIEEGVSGPSGVSNKDSPRCINNNYCKEEERQLHPTIAALAAACGEKILNPDFLLQGGGEPFVEAKVELKKEGGEDTPSPPSTSAQDNSQGCQEVGAGRPRITLHSQKMRGLKDLLLAEKLNTHAISLQLTAQSQVQVGKKTRGEPSEMAGPRPKSQVPDNYLTFCSQVSATTSPSVVKFQTTTSPSVVKFPTTTLPSVVKFPTTTLPSVVKFPTTTLPSVVKFPTTTLPSVVKFPTTTLPSVVKFPTTTLPSVVKFPTTTLPSVVKFPTTTLPSVVKFPTTTLPSVVKFPTTTLPSVVKFPTTTLPSVVKFPTTTLPSVVKFPTTTLPSVVKFPTTTLPSVVKFPTTTLPSVVKFPTTTLPSVVKFPTTTLPSVVKFPTTTLPSVVKFPTTTLPSVVKFPTTTLPSVVKFPTTTLPSVVKFPTTTLPSVVKFLASYLSLAVTLASLFIRLK